MSGHYIGPIKNLRNIVKDYRLRHEQNHIREKRFFSGIKDTLKLMNHAVYAKDEYGKRYSHQRRLKKRALESAHKIIAKHFPRLSHFKDFDGLHSALGHLLKVPGLGKLYVYDTALRLGFSLRMAPQKVYLHSGTLIGAKNLGLVQDNKTSFVARKDLPIELRSLSADVVEDILCIYKDSFKGPNKGVHKNLKSC